MPRLVLGRPVLAVELADDGVDHGENLETVAPSSSKKEEDGVFVLVHRPRLVSFHVV